MQRQKFPKNLNLQPKTMIIFRCLQIVLQSVQEIWKEFQKDYIG